MENIYQKMWSTAFLIIEQGRVSVDKNIDAVEDNRRGLTLLLRPSVTVLTNIQVFLEEAKFLEPEQYYYPISDLHTTVLSIISCRENFQLAQINLSDYKSLIIGSLKTISTIQLDYKGLTVSSSGVLAKGYEKGSNLKNCRANLRAVFKESKLENTIDQRYVLKTAHSTLIRFRQPLQNPKKFAQFLKHQKFRTFGACSIPQLELVYNDWYQRVEKVQLLKKIDLSTL